MPDTAPNFTQAIAHCLAYNKDQPPDADTFDAIKARVDNLFALSSVKQISREDIEEQYQAMANLPPIALVYGGATRVKSYVFEATRLPEIRGASALLDYVGSREMMQEIWRKEIGPGADWTDDCIIYASGGNVLGFAPASQAQAIAHAIEQRYTEHTLTAHSIAVALSFHPLEIRYGRLHFDKQGKLCTWVEEFEKQWIEQDLCAELASYYYLPPGVGEESPEAPRARFLNRKTFGELFTQLTIAFYKRRDELTPPGQGYTLLPWAEKCDSSDARPAVWRAPEGDDQRALSEASFRKREVGRVLKKQGAPTDWYESAFSWRIPDPLSERSWETQWESTLEGTRYAQAMADLGIASVKEMQPANDVGDIGQAGTGYIGIIYADGNNLGRLFATLQTPQEYAALADALDTVSKDVVFAALARHLKPVYARDEKSGQSRWVHPFEILAIGGDDLLVIVPGTVACDVAAEIGRHFEQSITEKFQADPILRTLWKQCQRGPQPASDHVPDRYQGAGTTPFRYPQPPIGISAGLVIAQENTPIFFLQNLVEQLQESAKKLVKQRVGNTTAPDQRGTIDFMVLKSIAMITDKISAFREAALGTGEDSIRRLTARPYTWHEFAGMLHTLRALKAAGFPKSQLYRLRRVMMDEEPTTTLVSTMEYLYTRVRLRDSYGNVMHQVIEEAWRGQRQGQQPSHQIGPWLPFVRIDDEDTPQQKWETIWADLGELYDLVEKPESQDPKVEDQDEHEPAGTHR